METPEIYAKTRREVAIEYCISVKTLYRWIKSAGIEIKQGLIRPNELKVIYNTFGAPQKDQTTF